MEGGAAARKYDNDNDNDITKRVYQARDRVYRERAVAVTAEEDVDGAERARREDGQSTRMDVEEQHRAEGQGKREEEEEEPAAVYRIVAGRGFSGDDIGMFTARFPPSQSDSAMLVDDGNLSKGKWKIVNGTQHENIEEGGYQTISRVGKGFDTTVKRRFERTMAHFDAQPSPESAEGWVRAQAFTLQEVTSDIVGDGATVQALREAPLTAGSKYIMLSLDKNGTLVASPVDHMYRCNVVTTKVLPKKAEAGAAGRDNVDAGPSKSAQNGGGDKLGIGRLKSLFRNRRKADDDGNDEDNKLAQATIPKVKSSKATANEGYVRYGIGAGDDDWQMKHGEVSDDDEDIAIFDDDREAPGEFEEFGWKREQAEMQDMEDNPLDALLEESEDEDGAGDDNGDAKENGAAEAQKPNNDDDERAKRDENASTKPPAAAGTKRERDRAGDDTNPPHQAKRANTSTAAAADVGVDEVVSVDELRAFLKSKGGIMGTKELSAAFKSRLKSKEARKAFANTVKEVAKKEKDDDGVAVVVLKR